MERPEPRGAWRHVGAPDIVPGRMHGRGRSGSSGHIPRGTWTGLRLGSWGGPCRSIVAPQGLFRDPVAPNPPGAEPSKPESRAGLDGPLS